MHLLIKVCRLVQWSSVKQAAADQLNSVADEAELAQHVEAGRAVRKSLGNSRQCQACIVHHLGILHNHAKNSSMSCLNQGSFTAVH